MADQKTGFLKKELSFGSVSITQKAFFAKNLAVMLTAGLTITDALSIAADSTSGKMKKILTEVERNVSSGRTLAESLAMHPKTFSPFFQSAVYAGEQSGTLDENLEQAAIQLTKEKELGEKIKGAMIYPAVILTASFVLGLFVSFYILPKIAPLFEGLAVELPWSTRSLIWFSNFVNDNKTALIIGIIVFLVGFSWLLRQKFVKPITHWIFLHIPVVKKIVRSANLARFSRVLGTLLKSGLNVDEAMGITRKSVGNYYYSESVGKAAERVSKGTPISESLEDFKKLYPQIHTRMIKVGEGSGKMDETLMYLAEFFEEEVDNATKNISTAVEPILLLIIGAAVGFLALAIITPIYSITGNIK